MSAVRALQGAALAGMAAIAAALLWQAPRILASLPFFLVDEVEVSGTRFLAPEAVIEAAGMGEGATVFDDLRTYRARALAHPLIEDASVRRRLPGTLLVQIREREPVALARTPELRPLDAAGRVLPLDAAGRSLDLPVLSAAPAPDDPEPSPQGAAETPGGAAQSHAPAAEPPAGSLAALAGFYDRLRRCHPELAARVSEVLAAEGGAVRLVLREPEGAVALLPGDAGAVKFMKLELTLASLEAGGEDGRVRRIDLSYREQVVVTFHGNGR